ncbi:peptidoglycan-binding protein [Myxococcaceae bacterium GXIMD 01537]
MKIESHRFQKAHNVSAAGTGNAASGKEGPKESLRPALDAFEPPKGPAPMRFNPPEPPAPMPNADLIGLKPSPNGQTAAKDKPAVEKLQHQLVELGYLTEAQVNGNWGAFGGKTEQALKDFQASQNLPQTGIVSSATALALADPRPSVDPTLRGIAAQHQMALGRPVGEAVRGEDGSITQQFDRGSVTLAANGDLSVKGAGGLDVTYKSGTTLESWAASGIYVNQMEGDPNASNGNCGFASAHMALEALGLPIPTPTGTAGTGVYKEVMELRKLGDGGDSDGVYGTAPQVIKALTESGATAAEVTNTWGANKAAGVEIMKQAFMDPSSQEAFVVAGNPTLGWDDKTNYNGAHYVAVVGYNPEKNVFIVMDPYVNFDPPGPIEVSPDQLAKYLESDASEAREIIQVTRPS